MVKVVVPQQCSICGYTTGHNFRVCSNNNGSKGSSFIKLFGVRVKRGLPNVNPNHEQPWSEEEHRLFLTGLQELGNGQWKLIARDYVKTRTPRQVATHAQKYYLRLKTPAELKIRRSIFDIYLEEPIVGVNGVNGPAVPYDQDYMYLPEGRHEPPYPAPSSSSTVIDPIDEAPLDGSPVMPLLNLELRLG